MMDIEDLLESVKFSSREIIEKTEITSKQQLSNTIKRFCDMYGFKMSDFKSDDFNEYSRYDFSALYSELLIIMLRNQLLHPLANAKTSETNVLATDLSSYYSALIKDIDELPKPLKNMVYAQSWHLTGDEISNWMTDFVTQLTKFIVSLVILPDENLGSSLRSFTKELDKASFFLFYKALVFKHAGIRTLGHPRGENTAMDKGMAELIKKLQTSDYTGINVEDIVDADDLKSKRFQLYQKIYDGFDCDYYAKSNRASVEALRQDKNTWQDFLSYIDTHNVVSTKEKKKSNANDGNATEAKNTYSETSNKKYEMADENPERTERVKKVFINEYIRYQQSTEKLYRELYGIVNKFVGSAVSVCQKYSGDILQNFLPFEEKSKEKLNS